MFPGGDYWFPTWMQEICEDEMISQPYRVGVKSQEAWPVKDRGSGSYRKWVG